MSGRPAAGPMRLFFVVMVMFGITTTLHGLSPLATYGLGAVFFLGLAVVCFLLPAGLVAAELATGAGRDGGVFVWVSEAFGPRIGFLATWLQWLQDIIFWTVILTGSAAMLAIGFGWDQGPENRPYTVAVVVGTIWATTALTALGLRSTGWVSTAGSLAGTVLPAAALVGFAVAYVVQGHESHLEWSLEALVPDLAEPSNLAFAISTIMVFAGIEVMGTRVSEIADARRTYPRATFVAIGLAVVVLTPTVLSIAVLVPAAELNITAGIVQAIETVFDTVWDLSWVPALFAVALLVDAVGEISGWMAGTPVAMARATEQGFLPHRLASTDGGVALPMLLTQAVLGSLISVVFIFVPSVEGVFWVLSALLVQLYLLMYALLFSSAWWRRRRRPPTVPGAAPDVEGAWRIPGGAVGITVVCGVGLAASLAAFVVGFLPPPSLGVSSSTYLVVLGAGLVVSLGAPAALIARWTRRRGRSTAAGAT